MIKRYEDISVDGLDLIREIGSIGNGNAATALSSMLNAKVHMSLPNVRIMDFNAAQDSLGDPEALVAAVLVELVGEVEGIMLLLLKQEFMDEVAQHLLHQINVDIMQLDELQTSALIECGNIMISSFVNAMTSLANVEIQLSVPQIAVNMLGGIMSMPMAMMGYHSDRIMMITGEFKIDGKEMDSNMLLLPDVNSLNVLMKKLGVS